MPRLMAVDSLGPEDLDLLGMRRRTPSPAAGSGGAGRTVQTNEKWAQFAAIAGPILGAVVGSMLNRPSSSERAARGAATNAANQQANEIQARNRLRNDLERMIRDRAGGGRPPFFPFDLENPANFEELFQGVAPMGDINHLMRLLGIPGTGTGAIGAATGLAGADSAARRQNAAATGEIVSLLLGSLFGPKQSTMPNYTFAGNSIPTDLTFL